MIADKLRTTTSGIDPAWDLASATYQGSPINWFRVAAQETDPQGVFFKPDGLKMYIVGNAGDDVNEYTLSTAWNISTASYVQNFSVAAQESFPQGVFFKPDGLKMYIIGFGGDDVNEYNLSTAWNISTASYVQNFSVAAQESGPRTVFFKPDGLKMYIVGNDGDDVNEYNLSTAWNISTASYVQNFSVAAQETEPQGIFFKPDGLKMYIVGASGDDVNEYNLSIAWDISTASYLQNFSVAAQDLTPTGLFFKSDGLKMYVMGNAGDAVYEYNLLSAWDISTTVFTYPTTNFFSVAPQETSPTGLFFKPDGLKMYVTGSSGDDVDEYSLSTAWDISTASYLQNFSVAAQDTSPSDIFFKPDGLKMYIMGFGSYAVYEYNLSAAWDISTASYLQNFSVSTQDLAPRSMTFKSDGLKMYMIGSGSDSVHEYNLSTAWDISTASYLQSFSVAAQNTDPRGLFFKPDGLKMYIMGVIGDAVYEYDLSTAWDISTVSYLQNFSVAAQETFPTGLFFKPTGLKMYIIGNTFDAVFSYDFV
jgi:DNA-binding beta-propeller fold protein YncE